MTTIERSQAECRETAPACAHEMDRRSRAICAEVWRCWAEGKPAPTYRDLCDVAGLASVSSIEYYVTGRGWYPRKDGGLIARGWLTTAGWKCGRTLLPGPRFVGLDNGWPIEVKQDYEL